MSNDPFGWGMTPQDLQKKFAQQQAIAAQQQAARQGSPSINVKVNNFGSKSNNKSSGSGGNGNFKMTKRQMFYAGGAFLALVLFLGSFSTVSPGQRGIRVTMGSASNETLGEGVHFKLPLVSSIKTVSIKVQKTEATSEAATKDLQKVHATFALNWNLNPENVVEVYRSIGDESDIAERVIAPAISEVLKAATAHMTAEEVLTKRLELKQIIDGMLTERLAKYTILVKDISLVNLDFTGEFNRAVEAKQVAEQEAKKAEYVAIQAKNDAVARVNKAKGEADSALLMAKSQAEAQRLLQQNTSAAILQLKAIEKWDGTMPTVMGNGGGMIFNIPTKGSGEAK